MVVNPDNGEHEVVADAPTRELAAALAPARSLPAVLTAGSEDRCTNCGAPLAHDQRYCIECGEPRGASTMPKPQETTEIRTTRVRSAVAPRPPRVSSGTTVVSFVGVLLLAIGLGVLIGRIGQNGNSKSGTPATQVISVNGGGASAGTASTPTVPTTTTSSHLTPKSQSKLNSAAKATALPPAAVQKKATQAAGKVLGNSNNLAPPTVTNGQKCSSNQAGCSGGNFNGNFFGQ